MGVSHCWKERYFPLLQRCASIFHATDAPALDTTSPAFLNPSKTNENGLIGIKQNVAKDNYAECVVQA